MKTLTVRYESTILDYVQEEKNTEFSWVPSHVNVCGNEITDSLAPVGSHKDSTYGAYLTFVEIVTRIKQNISPSWKKVPVHEWYVGNRPGTALLRTSGRRDDTTLARLHSGHIRVQRHEAELEVYPSCRNCNVTQDAPAHILACIGCHTSQLLSRPATVLQCLKTHGFTDLIKIFLSIKWYKKQQHMYI
ncbi:RNase H domain-containing protein [Trichonephila clavipes]|nr:RNase H domain-containing protein [Trichonephila clavipes]